MRRRNEALVYSYKVLPGLAAAVALAASPAAPFPVLALVAVALAAVVTVAAVLAGEATLAVVELVVEAAVVDVEDGVEDAVRELCPVDGRLQNNSLIKRNQSFIIKFITKSVQAWAYMPRNTHHIWAQDRMRRCQLTPSQPATVHRAYLPAQTLFTIHQQSAPFHWK
jgi:hypothetical protein